MRDTHPVRDRFPHSCRRKGIIRWRFPYVLFLIASVFGQAFAQSTDAIDQEVVELPPFQVSPSKGWRAPDTLIGTRLRTSYDKLPTQIEVLTPDFMEDYALNSTQDAAIYTINVESPSEYSTSGGYPSIREGDFFFDGGLRIRGLEDVTRTRFFFSTLLPLDNYNLNRSEISYGPNSILFATRGHSGAVNMDPSPAVFRNGGSLGAQFDSNGSMRFQLDYNQVLIDDQLAVRGAVLYDDGAYEVQPDSKQDRRAYATINWKPFKTTSIRAYAEFVDLDASRSPRALPYEEISPWFEAASLPNSRFNEDRPIFQNDIAWQESDQPLSSQSVFTSADKGKPVLFLNQGRVQNHSSIARPQDYVEIKRSGLWLPRSSLDYGSWHTLRDDTYFPTDVNLGAATNFQESQGHALDLVINQEILESLNLELAAHSEKIDVMAAYGLSTDAGSSGYTVKVDANSYLEDGTTPNPNVGRFYVESPVQYDSVEEATNQARAVLSWEHDFETSNDDRFRWLGKHRLVGMVSMERSQTKHQQRYYRIVPRVLPDGDLLFPTVEGIDWNNAWIGHRKKSQNAASQLVLRHYLDLQNGITTASLPFKVGQPFHLVDSAGVPFTIDPENTGFSDDQGRRLTTGDTRNNLKWMEDSFQISYQGFFLDSRLILTYGWRTIDFNTADFPADYDGSTGMVVHQDDAVYNDYVFYDDGSTDSGGIVIAPFRGWLDLPADADLTLFYQRSNTYQPKNRPHDPFGNRYPGAHGEGEDLGFNLSMAQGRFSFRFNAYRLNIGPAEINGSGHLPRQLRKLEARILELDPGFPRLEGDTEYAFPSPFTNSLYRHLLVADKYSSGYEISAYWAASRNLEFRFNAADMEVVRSNTGLEWWDWIERRLPMYQNFNVIEGGATDPRDVDGNGLIENWTWETALYDAETTLAGFYELNVTKAYNGKDLMQARDGKSDPFIRNLRLNLNGMYRFDEGPLRGLKLGGAVRWREPPLLGYEETRIQGEPTYDLDKPLYGVSEWYLDLVARYRFNIAWMGDRAATVSLNVRNALDRDDPVPYRLDVNGDPTHLARVEGRKFILSLKLEL